MCSTHHVFVRHYTGRITLYRLRPRALAEYNVGVFGGYQLPGTWITTATPADGLLQTASDKSNFWLLSPADKDHANGVDEDFTIHIEYLDKGPQSFSVVGFNEGGFVPFSLADVKINGSGEWSTADVLVKQGSNLGDVFYLTSSVTVRTLEMRRFNLVGVDILRSSADATRHWFLRFDGYLESTTPTACDIRPVVSSDASTTDTSLTFTWLYAGGWIDSKVTYSPGSNSCLPEWLYDFIVRRVALDP